MRIALLLLACSLAACARPEAEVPASTPAPASAPTPASAPASETAATFDPDCRFCANPSFVRTCEVAQGVRTTLYWNIADAVEGNLGIYVVDDAGKDAPFAEQPAKGSIETGPWLKPGLTFKLKDAGGNVLETVVISGKDC